MRVCDRHRDRPARETVHIANDDQRFDLCDECKTELLMYLVSEPTKLNGARRGRPPKESATAETSAP